MNRPMVAQGPRRIIDVIDQMLERVPNGDPLYTRLQWLRRDASYKAPEMAGESWFLGNEILSEEFGPPSQLVGWQAEVASIWMNTPIPACEED
jgi:hypothetical protein